MIGPVYFANNKYLKWYLNICNSAQDRVIECGELHHMLPKAFGGTNGDNLVLLSTKEHFLCHWLLTKFTFGADKRKMCYALNFMTRGTAKHASRIKSSWRIALAKKAQREGMLGNIQTLGQKRGEEFRAICRERMLGNKHTLGRKLNLSVERLGKMRAAMLGNKRGLGWNPSDEIRNKMRIAQTGRKHSEETKAKMRLSGIGTKKGKSTSEFMGVSKIKRYGGKCKWQSQLKSADTKLVNYFDFEIDAAICWNTNIAYRFGDSVRLNTIPDGIWPHE